MIIQYKIVRKIGELPQIGKGYVKQLNLVEWDGHAAKKAFKQDVKMSDLDKELCDAANRKTLEKMTVDIVTMMLRATCLTVMHNFKEITKKETRIENTVKIVHDYVMKLKNHELSRDDMEVIQEVEAAMKQSVEEEE